MTEKWTAGIFGLLAGCASNRVLMVASGDGWSLPGCHLEGRPELSAGLATGEMSRLLGVPVIAYRFARLQKDRENHRQEGVFVLEALEEHPGLTDAMRWVSRTALRELTLQHPDHLPVIDEYLNEWETGIVPPFRRPWEHPGWYAQACRWIEETLASLGSEMIASPEQVRWWSLACVLRVPTSRGNVYFKASARQPLFVGEGVLLSYLEGVFPDRIPRLLATHAETGWILLDDAGAVHHGPMPVERATEIVSTWGGLQRATVPHVDTLRSLGVADRRPHTLIPLIQPLLDDELAVAHLTSDEIGELQRRMPEMIDMCRRLSESSVPPTLIHGDLHAENFVTGGAPIFIDWTEACIAHPFMDMFMIFNETEDSIRNRTRDDYLAIWTSFETTERLRELWSLCGVVHALHHAVGYWAILHRTEERSRGEMAEWLPFLLRKALRFLRDPE
ncbi:MAG: aminoglycoside phosphotransferase family protein [Chloroflexota bacterium]|jgi:hypothetical protein|nr:aminoglycoside phosphotransferase family protein [Chloroflexota bacterium]